MKKSFSFKAVMSIVTARHLATLEEENQLSTHLVGVSLDGVRSDGFYTKLQAVLFKQFPGLGGKRMQAAVGKLILLLESQADQQIREEAIASWLSKQSVRLDIPLKKRLRIIGGGNYQQTPKKVEKRQKNSRKR